ncbi:rhodanese-like domain-containing protein [Bhargavaea massiliensis]
MVVCRLGNRSAQASKLLVKEGFTNIYNMNGGMNEWKGEVEK